MSDVGISLTLIVWGVSLVFMFRSGSRYGYRHGYKDACIGMKRKIRDHIDARSK